MVDGIETIRFQVQLQRLLEQLRQPDATAAAASAVVELDPSRVGRLSRMDALQAQAMSLAATRRRASRIAGIEAALQRIAAGAYGQCPECCAQIAPARLEVDPAAVLCLRCAGAHRER